MGFSSDQSSLHADLWWPPGFTWAKVEHACMLISDLRHPIQVPCNSQSFAKACMGAHTLQMTVPD